MAKRTKTPPHLYKTTTRRPWLMLKHQQGSDYGSGAYTLYRHGKGGAIIVSDGLSTDEARLIEASPIMRRLLLDVLALYRDEFYTDAPINGADFLAAVAEWRLNAKRIMERDRLL